MKASLIITLIGPDNNGIVNSVSSVLTQFKANWVESRLGHLNGRFAGMIGVTANKADIEPLKKALNEMAASQDLVIVCQEEMLSESENLATIPLMISIMGTDRIGIIHDLSDVLVAQRVNVEEISTETRDAPMSGEPLFTASVTVTAPENIDMDQLQDALEGIDDALEFEVEKQETA